MCRHVVHSKGNTHGQVSSHTPKRHAEQTLRYCISPVISAKIRAFKKCWQGRSRNRQSSTLLAALRKKQFSNICYVRKHEAFLERLHFEISHSCVCTYGMAHPQCCPARGAAGVNSRQRLRVSAEGTGVRLRRALPQTCLLHLPLSKHSVHTCCLLCNRVSVVACSASAGVCVSSIFGTISRNWSHSKLEGRKRKSGSSYTFLFLLNFEQWEYTACFENFIGV